MAKKPWTLDDLEFDKFDQNSSNETVVRVLDKDVLTALNNLGGASNGVPVIYNVTVGLANTEFSQALPGNCKEFFLKARGNAKIQVSYTSGDSGLNFITVPPGAVFNDENFYVSQTIYFQTNKPDVIEIRAVG